MNEIGSVFLLLGFVLGDIHGGGVARLVTVCSPEMTGRYYCAYCEYEFIVDDGGERPSCPRCGQTEPVRSVDPFGLVRAIWGQWLVVIAILVLTGAGFVLYQWTRTR